MTAPTVLHPVDDINILLAKAAAVTRALAFAVEHPDDGLVNADYQTVSVVITDLIGEASALLQPLYETDTAKP